MAVSKDRLSTILVLAVVLLTWCFLLRFMEALKELLNLLFISTISGRTNMEVVIKCPMCMK